MNNIICTLLLLTFTLYANDTYYDQEEQTNPSSNESYFECDGRQYCSQMRSCEEAKFFINNCSNTKMDGNNDGIPCERQWCNK